MIYDYFVLNTKKSVEFVGEELSGVKYMYAEDAPELEEVSSFKNTRSVDLSKSRAGVSSKVLSFEPGLEYRADDRFEDDKLT